jgi:hypothetical protein
MAESKAKCHHTYSIPVDRGGWSHMTHHTPLSSENACTEEWMNLNGSSIGS